MTQAQSLPFFDLYESLLRAGLKLTLAQYDQFLEALQKGFGLFDENGWHNLKELCELLWVKPSPNFDRAIFEKTFTEYVHSHEGQMNNLMLALSAIETPQAIAGSRPPKNIQLGQLPVLPPRKHGSNSPITQTNPQGTVVSALQIDRPSSVASMALIYRLTPQDLPVTTLSYAQHWRSMPQGVAFSKDLRLDLRATERSIVQAWPDCKPIYRPRRCYRGNLVLLVDNVNSMRPFLPLIQQFSQAILDQQVSPAKIFQFTDVPEDYVYDWHRSYEAIALAELIETHTINSGTLLMVMTDAGAVRKYNFAERVRGYRKFLQGMKPLVKQIVTLNPMPESEWQGTRAQALNQCPEHQQLYLGKTVLWALEELSRQSIR